jgi:hypothetical protein
MFGQLTEVLPPQSAWRLQDPVDDPGAPVDAGALVVQADLDDPTQDVPLTRQLEADLTDFFAPAQYFEMDQTKTLTAPSFTRFKAGYTFDVADALLLGSEESSEVEYDTFIVDTHARTAEKLAAYKIQLDMLEGMLRLGAAATSGMFKRGPDAFFDFGAPRRFGLKDPTYVVTRRSDGKGAGVMDTPATRVEAMIVLDEHLATNPQDRGQLQVVRQEFIVAA